MADSTKSAFKNDKEKLSEITDSIERGIKELFASDKYKQYLQTMSRFHRYSVNNQILIFMQKPDASLVAGFNKWKDSFGRNVRRGEKGIKIIAPAPYKKKIEKEKLDPDTKLPLLDENGQPIKEEKEVNVSTFKVVSVFDVSQTEGKPLPEISSDLSGSVEHYDTFMEAIKRSSPVPIDFKPIKSGADGYFSYDNQSITLREGMSETQTVCAAIHEVAHSKLHNYSRKAHETDVQAKDRRTEEVEAESIAYTVCAYFGIETSGNSFGYLASWSSDKELKELKSSLETINKTSSELITAISRNFKEICKERGIDFPSKHSPASQEAAEMPGIEANFTSELPDPTVTVKIMENYGYTDSDMLPLSKDRAMELFERDVTVYCLHSDNTEAMVIDETDLTNHYGIFGITREDWDSIKADTPTGDVEKRFMDNPNDAVLIYQITHDDPNNLMFARYDSLSEPPKRDNYEAVYTAPIEAKKSKTATLEEIYQRFNVDRPLDFTGHSLSVSDILAIKHNGDVSYHYCDIVGFKELPDFQKSNYLKSAEISIEDDYGMIDGIINNGKKETADNGLESKVNAGKSVSLKDQAKAIEDENQGRKSIAERLRQKPPKQKKSRTAPKNNAERSM